MTLLLGTMAVAPAADAQSPLTFSKSFSPSTIGPGSVSTLRFDIDNQSSTGFRGLAFTDSLPSGVTIASPANATSTCFGTLSAPDGGMTIDFSGGAIGVSGSCFITVDVTSSTPGTHTNVSGDLTSDAGNSGSATADLTVATDRPGFTKSFSPASVSFGGRSTVTFTIDNSANSAAALQLIFTDTLPAGLTVASPANASTTCGGTLSAPAGGSVVSLGFSSPPSQVDAGSTCTVKVDVIGASLGALGNTSGELTSGPAPTGFPTRSSGKASAVLTVTADRLTLAKTFTDDPAAAGDTVTLEFTIRNLDRSSTATSIAFSDNLDAALTGLEAVGLPTNPCGSGSAISGTSMISLTGGSVDPEGSCTFSVTLQVPSTAVPGSYVNTTSTITGDLGGSPTTGSAAADQLFVSAAPRLTKSFIDDPVGAGGSATLEFTITNTSPTSSATDIAFEDVFDTILPTASVVPTTGFCGSGSSATFTPLANVTPNVIPARLTISGASLDPGTSCMFSITLDVTEDAGTGTYPNVTSDITATVGGETLTGSPATDDLVIAGSPTLAKSFTDDPVAPGGTVTLEFTLSYSEEAVGDATSIAFTDDLMAVLSGLMATDLPKTDVCGTGSQLSGTTNLSFSGGTLSPGETCTFSATLQVPSAAPSGTFANTTSNVSATVGATAVTSTPGTDDLTVTGLTFSKSFTDDPVIAGQTVTLEFTLDNTNGTVPATGIAFSDSLSSVLSGLVSTSGTSMDVCGTGSQIGGTGLVGLSGGNLAVGESCTFSFTLQVPSGAAEGVYPNATSNLVAAIDGTNVVLPPATDALEISNTLLVLSKDFIDDPVSPNDTVTLEFTLLNLADKAASSLAFTDDLDGALAGLASVSGTLTDVCGTGSQVTGTGMLTFSGGSLGAGESCTFSVTLQVPGDVALGTLATNTTSEVTGTILGFPVSGDPASDDLQIDFLSFSKSFSGPVEAGDTVTLLFSLQNASQTATIDRIAFTDDLDAALSGLVATGLPQSDVCGTGSELQGTDFLTLTGASLAPNGSCTFSVDLQVPASAEPGLYVNETSDVTQNGLRAGPPATAVLTIIEVTDEDGDGILDDDDVCPGTVIPEGVPTVRLGTNRFALVDGDGVFDTNEPNGEGPGVSFTIEDTAGCSCEQIIAAQGLGKGHEKFGCSISAMEDWVALVNP